MHPPHAVVVRVSGSHSCKCEQNGKGTRCCGSVGCRGCRPAVCDTRHQDPESTDWWRSKCAAGGHRRLHPGAAAEPRSSIPGHLGRGNPGTPACTLSMCPCVLHARHHPDPHVIGMWVYIAKQEQSNFASIIAAMEVILQVHVIDAASDDALQQRHTVLRTLRQLGMSEEDLTSRVLEVWNKADRLNASAPTRPQPGRPHSLNPPPTYYGTRESPRDPEPLTDTEPAQEALWAALCGRIKAAAMQNGRRHSQEVAEHLAEARRRGHRRTAHTAGRCLESGTLPDPESMDHRHHSAECSPPTGAPDSQAREREGHRHDRRAEGGEPPEKAVGGPVGNGGMSIRTGELLATAVPEMQHEVVQVAPAGGLRAREPQHVGRHRATVPLVVSAATGFGLGRLQLAIHERLTSMETPKTGRDAG